SVAEVVYDRLQRLGVPIGIGYPFGHVPDSWTLPLGIQARLDTGAGTLELLEPAGSRGSPSTRPFVAGCRRRATGSAMYMRSPFRAASQAVPRRRSRSTGSPASFLAG